MTLLKKSIASIIYEERVQGDLPNVQDGISTASIVVERGSEGVMPKRGVSG